MIRVTIELLPQGDEKRKKQIGLVKIINNGRGTATHGDYHVELWRRDIKSVWKTGRFSGFPRKRLGVYDLLFRALLAVVGGRNVKEVRDLQ